jgi:hypothetical protein
MRRKAGRFSCDVRSHDGQHNSTEKFKALHWGISKDRAMAGDRIYKEDAHPEYSRSDDMGGLKDQVQHLR